MKLLRGFILLGTVIALFSCNNSNQKPNTSANQTIYKGAINISAERSMYYLANEWAVRYGNQFKDIKLNVNIINIGQTDNVLNNNSADIVFLGSDNFKTTDNKELFYIPVAKDAVLPIISADNPLLSQLLNYGLNRIYLSDIFISGKIAFWEQVNSKNKTSKINVYKQSAISSDTKIWLNFLQTDYDKLRGKEVENEDQMLKTVQNDKLSIGYISTSYAYDNYSLLEFSGIKVLPYDINGNEMIDDDEFFYHKKDLLIKAVESGKMPQPPTRNLYFVLKTKPENKILENFIKWVLTIGKNYVPDMGYANLTKAENEAAINKIK